MTLTVLAKANTFTNGTANDASPIDSSFVDAFNNDSTIATYVNTNLPTFSGSNTFTSTNTFSGASAVTLAGTIALSGTTTISGSASVTGNLNLSKAGYTPATNGDIGYDSTGNKYMVQVSGASHYLIHDGNLPAGVSAAVKADQTTGTSTTVYVSPGTQQYHASAAKAWMYYNRSTSTLVSNYGVTSVANGGTGVFTATLTTAMTTTNFIGVGICDQGILTPSAPASTTTQAFSTYTYLGNQVNGAVNSIVWYGVQ